MSPSLEDRKTLYCLYQTNSDGHWVCNCCSLASALLCFNNSAKKACDQITEYFTPQSTSTLSPPSVRTTCSLSLSISSQAAASKCTIFITITMSISTVIEKSDTLPHCAHDIQKLWWQLHH